MGRSNSRMKGYYPYYPWLYRTTKVRSRVNVMVGSRVGYVR